MSQNEDCFSSLSYIWRKWMSNTSPNCIANLMYHFISSEMPWAQLLAFTGASEDQHVQQDADAAQEFACFTRYPI